MSNEQLFETAEIKKLISANISTTTINRLADFVKTKKLAGFKMKNGDTISKSTIIEKSLNDLLDKIDNSKNSLFGDSNG